MNEEFLVRKAIESLRHVGPFRYRVGDERHVLDGLLWERVRYVFRVSKDVAIEMCEVNDQDPYWDERNESRTGPSEDFPAIERSHFRDQSA